MISVFLSRNLLHNFSVWNNFGFFGGLLILSLRIVVVRITYALRYHRKVNFSTTNFSTEWTFCFKHTNQWLPLYNWCWTQCYMGIQSIHYSQEKKCWIKKECSYSWFIRATAHTIQLLPFKNVHTHHISSLSVWSFQCWFHMDCYAFFLGCFIWIALSYMSLTEKYLYK